jgi:hypothetical protein
LPRLPPLKLSPPLKLPPLPLPPPKLPPLLLPQPKLSPPLKLLKSPKLPKPLKLPKPVLWARKPLGQGPLERALWLKRLRQSMLLRRLVGKALVRLQLRQQCNQPCRPLALRRVALPQYLNPLELRL